MKRRSRSLPFLVSGAAAASLLAACATSSQSSSSAEAAHTASAPSVPAPAPAAPAAPAPKPRYGTFGFDTDGMDRSVPPGESFYRYANGGWNDRTEIPADRTRYGMFTALADEAAKQSRALIEGAAASEGASGDEKKLGDYFATFMDEAAIEAKGLAPVQPELQKISALASKKALSAALGDTLRADVDALNMGDVTTQRLFGLWVSEDLNDPTRYTAYLLQGGLGLPDRDYYLVDNARFTELRGKYQQHIAALLKLAGIADADAKAKKVFELEKRIAQAHWSQVDTRDILKANNPWKRADFGKKAPGLDWDAYLTAAGLGAQQDFIVWPPSALTGISKLVGSEPLQTWKDYLSFQLLARAAPFLPKAFVQQDFEFNDKTLAGAQQLRERWKRGVQVTDDAMGEATGKLYVEKHFPARAKAEADAMVKNIVQALGHRIDALEWMTPATKAKAREKLGTVQVGSSRVDLQACKLEYSIVSPK